MEKFIWSEAGAFIDREAERARLERWWRSPERQPINLYGRRRAGKSWLFRRVANGKPAVLLVARRSAPGRQLGELASQLEPLLGVRPDVPDVPSLFRVLLRAARSQKFLAVIDELPYLFPRGRGPADEVSSGIAAVLEEELAQSHLKLIVCGSAISVMESLQSERSPLFGRFTPLGIRPLSFEHARLFMRGLPALESFERFAVAGGMPRYLTLLGEGTIKQAVVTEILDQNAPLFDEVRAVLGQELIQPGQHFAILEQLASGDKAVGEIAGALRQKAAELTPYLDILSRLGLVERRLPIGAPRSARLGHWHLTDPFFAFWFRFVFPFQDGLESGLRPQDLFDAEVAPVLASHVSSHFEDWARSWARRRFGREATAIAPWWGKAADEHRRSGERSTEEIGMVGMARSKVTLLGEAKWTNRPMPVAVLDALERYKIPALRQAGFKLPPEPTVVLLSKSGYSAPLRERAARDGNLILVDVAEELTTAVDEEGAAPGAPR